jgi:hypothetical protein
MRDPTYQGVEPDILYVVWADNEWRTYASLAHAQRYYLKMVAAGKQAKIMSYTKKTYLGSNI